MKKRADVFSRSNSIDFDAVGSPYFLSPMSTAANTPGFMTPRELSPNKETPIRLSPSRLNPTKQPVPPQDTPLNNDQPPEDQPNSSDCPYTKPRPQWKNSYHSTFCIFGMMLGVDQLVYGPYYIQGYGFNNYLLTNIIMAVLFGYPVLILMVGISQFTSKGPGGCWEFAKLYTGVGYVILFFQFFDTSRYFQRATWVIELMTSKMLERHHEMTDMMYMHANKTENIISKTLGNDVIFSYVFNSLLVIALLFPNITTRGKFGTYIFILNITILALICVNALTLPGALNGLKLFEFHSWEPLLHVEVWDDSFHNIFFMTRLMPGYHMTLASYNHFNNQIPYDTLFILVVNFSFSFGGFVLMFSLLGHLSSVTGLSVEEVIDKVPNGNDMLLVSLPLSLVHDGDYGLWGYLLLVVLASILHFNVNMGYEVIITGAIDILDLSHSKRKIVVLLFCIPFFFGTFWKMFDADHALFELVTQISTFNQPVLSLLFVAPFTWVYGVNRILSMIECSVGWCTTPVLSNHWWKMWWRVCWKFILPVMYVWALVMMKFSKNKLSSELTSDIVLGTTAVTITIVIVTIIYLIIKTKEGGLRARYRYLVTPTDKWGPLLPNHKRIMLTGIEDDIRDQERRRKKSSYIAETYEDLSLLF